MTVHCTACLFDAGGVVGGVVVIALVGAIAAVTVMIMNKKRKREMEEDRARQVGNSLCMPEHSHT